MLDEDNMFSCADPRGEDNYIPAEQMERITEEEESDPYNTYGEPLPPYMDQPPAPAFRPENQSDPYPPTPPSGWKIPDNKFEKPENYPHAKIVNWVGKKLKVRIPPYNFFLDQPCVFYYFFYTLKKLAIYMTGCLACQNLKLL
jgi:hypothetical protein